MDKLKTNSHNVIDVDDDQWTMAYLWARVWYRLFGTGHEFSGHSELFVRTQCTKSACRNCTHVSRTFSTQSKWYVTFTTYLQRCITTVSAALCWLLLFVFVCVQNQINLLCKQLCTQCTNCVRFFFSLFLSPFLSMFSCQRSNDMFQSC